MNSDGGCPRFRGQDWPSPRCCQAMPGRSQAIRHCPQSGSIRARASTDFIEPGSIRMEHTGSHACVPWEASSCRKCPTTIVAADNGFASRAMDMGTRSCCKVPDLGSPRAERVAACVRLRRSSPSCGRHRRRHPGRTDATARTGRHPDDNQTGNTLTIFCPFNPSGSRILAGSPCQSDRRFAHGHS